MTKELTRQITRQMTKQMTRHKNDQPDDQTVQTDDHDQRRGACRQVAVSGSLVKIKSAAA